MNFNMRIRGAVMEQLQKLVGRMHTEVVCDEEITGVLGGLFVIMIRGGEGSREDAIYAITKAWKEIDRDAATVEGDIDAN